MDALLPQAHQALGHYDLGAADLTAVTLGNINDTYFVDSVRGRFVLQKLNPIFRPEIHYDIASVTKHLAARGVATPVLVPTKDGHLWVGGDATPVWRLQTFVPGIVHSQADDPKLCHAAGVLLAQFHAALSDYNEPFAAQRVGVHDTANHLRRLEEVLSTHKAHPAYDQVAPLAQEILQQALTLPNMLRLPERVVHGDAKLNNIIFHPDGTAAALVDLDTLGRMPLPHELGDAWRSWCNPGGENHTPVEFSLPHFKAALAGYAQGASVPPSTDECALLPAAVPTIALELAARFARDALEESYFRWDKERYHHAWQHNLVRARSQHGLYQSCKRQKAEMEEAVHLSLDPVQRLLHHSN